jgi:threonyl-tRNA synthetase
MIKIMNKGYPLRREEVTRAEAERRIKELNEPYKLEILESIKARLTGGESADCSAHP